MPLRHSTPTSSKPASRSARSWTARFVSVFVWVLELEPVALGHGLAELGVGADRVPPARPVLAVAGVALGSAPVELARELVELRTLEVVEVITVGQEAARTQEPRARRVHGPERVGLEPVERGRREHGVVGAGRDPVGPVRPAQVGVHHLEACRRGRAGEGQQNRIGVDADDRGVGQPREHAQRERCRPAGQVENPRARAGGRLEQVDEDLEALLAFGQIRLLLGVPAIEPRGRHTHSSSLRHLRYRIS